MRIWVFLATLLWAAAAFAQATTKAPNTLGTVTAPATTDGILIGSNAQNISITNLALYNILDPPGSQSAVGIVVDGASQVSISHTYVNNVGDVGFLIDGLPPPPSIFQLIQRVGNVSNAEMHQVYNMGIGFCVLVAETDRDPVDLVLHRAGVGIDIDAGGWGIFGHRFRYSIARKIASQTKALPAYFRPLR